MARVPKPKPKPPVPPPVPPAPPAPPAPPVPPAPPAPASKLGDPTGTIGGPLKVAYGRGAPWADVNRWDTHFLKYGAKHKVPPQMLKAMSVIESGGQMIWNQGGSGAYGIMQIKAAIWQARASALGYDLQTPEGQIGMAAAILGGAIAGVTGSTPEERFLSTYYPTPCLDCKGEDGATPRQYLADMHELMAQIDAAAGGTTPAPPPPPKPKPVTAADVLRLVAGPDAYVSFEYRGINPGKCYYEYFVGHGGENCYQHPGIDIAVPRGTELRTPLAGRITCVGAAGEVVWGQGCGYFNDSGGGIGNVTVLTDAGVKLTFGHSSQARVALNDRVQAGQVVSLSGSGDGFPHCHFDVVTNRGGQYWLNDPLPFLASLLGGTTLPVERVPIPQPEAFGDEDVTDCVALENTAIYQRADPKSPKVDTLTKGEKFSVVYQVKGMDGKLWWIGRHRGRVPMAGTECKGWGAA